MKWREAGGEADLDEWSEMVHVCHSFAGAMPEADAAVDAIGGWVRRRLEVVTPIPSLEAR